MRSHAPTGWLIGVITAGVAVGVGEFAAAFVRPAASPIIAVGNRVITLTPQSTKRAAIDSAGTSDKTLLIGSILLLLAVLGAAVGAAAVRRLRNGYLGLGLVTAFGIYCALTANAAQGTDVLPTLVGGLAAAGVLTVLVRLARATDGAARAGADAGPVPNRRALLQAAGLSAALAAVAGLGGRSLQGSRFDVTAARAAVTLPPATGTGTQAATLPRGVELGRSGVPWRTPNRGFYRIDTALSVPQIAPKDWRLRVHGMVEREITLTYEQLLARPLVEHWVTLCCVSNEIGGDLISNSLFRGALLADLLREAGVSAGADQLLMSSQDGMTIGAPTAAVMDGRAALLAVGMDGEPLPVEHGFPVRVVVPGLYGYVSACKWVVDIEATTFAHSPAYWIQGGWAATKGINTSSRIDRPTSSGTVSVGQIATIAGVAWDQHVGVGKVEVRIDGEPWRTARLAAVPSTDTWRQWVLAWTPQRSGAHRITVRATDAEGTVQDSQQRGVFPSGATGLHSITVNAVV